MALSGATTLGQSEPESDGNEGVLRIPKALASLEPHYQIVKCYIQDTRWEGLTQPTGQATTLSECTWEQWQWKSTLHSLNLHINLCRLFNAKSIFM